MSVRKKKHGISTFNAACFALAAFLFSWSILAESPENVAMNARVMVGAVVGAYASVAPNPDNTLAAEFAQKEKELQGREAAVLARENQQNWKNNLAVYSIFLSIALFILVGVNFFLDWRRTRQRNPFTVIVSKS